MKRTLKWYEVSDNEIEATLGPHSWLTIVYNAKAAANGDPEPFMVVLRLVCFEDVDDGDFDEYELESAESAEDGKRKALEYARRLGVVSR